MRLRATLSLCLTSLGIACQATGPSVAGARFVVRAPTGPDERMDTFRIVLQDSAEIGNAERVLQGGAEQVVAGRLKAGDGGFNAPWHWHLDPDSTWLVGMAVELCQGTPSAVEHELEGWLKYGLLCVTPAEIIRRER